MTIFTEPAKTNVKYTDPIQQEVTPIDMAGATPKDMAGLTPYDFKRQYGKKINSPTFMKPAKTSPVFTEPTK
jgi:hypothetical protein